MPVGVEIYLNEVEMADSGRLEFRPDPAGGIAISGFFRLTDTNNTAKQDINISDWPAGFNKTTLVNQLGLLIAALIKEKVPGATTVTRNGTRFVAS